MLQSPDRKGGGDPVHARSSRSRFCSSGSRASVRKCKNRTPNKKTMTEQRREQLKKLEDEIVSCHKCPRLVEWREQKANEKRAAYSDQTYWGKPVPGIGDPEAELVLVGLAPGAHGANRTGIQFGGDSSGEWLYRALYRAGYADRPDWEDVMLDNCWITAAVRCAPPENRPKADERKNCRPYLERELDLLADKRAILALGGYAYRHVLRIYRDRDYDVPSPIPDFEHNSSYSLGEIAPRLFVSYHPSQQNTFTGVLTEDAFDQVFENVNAFLA